MSLKVNNICRLCFKVASTEFEKINEIIKEILEVLLVNVNLNVTENSIICWQCTNTIKKSFYFKSLCMDTEKDIFSFAAEKPKNTFNLKDIYNAKDINSLEVTKEDSCICRFCFKQLQNKNGLSLDDMTNDAIFMEMLPICMSEMDFSITQTSVICIFCKENLENYLKFMWNYLNMEARIRGDIDSETVFSEVYGGLLKTETLDIRDEDDVMTQISLEVGRYRHKCTECTFETKYKNQLKRHMLGHKDPSKIKMYKCTLCRYETKRKDRLKMHMLIHKDTSEMEMYRCGTCTFETKYKRNLKYHMLKHKDISEVKIFKCTYCTYETRRKRYLDVHMVMHKDPSEVKIFKCTYCTYETRLGGCLDIHVLTHKDPSEVEMYKCAICMFETKYKASLKSHMLIHKDPSEVNVFKCTYCTYETKSKRYLNAHVVTHKDTSKMQMYKCATCMFENKYKGQLKRHMLVHKDSSEVKMYKCTLCNYETKRKDNLKMHMLTHRNESEVVTYKCPVCPTTTTQKPYLRKHILRRHKEALSNETYTNRQNWSNEIGASNLFKEAAITIYKKES